MRKKWAFISLVVSLFACLVGGVSGAISWFIETVTIGNQSSLVGESQGAYFARGEGTLDSPYIINKPIHLYNLAWLQYIGFFNDDNAPYYFELDDQDDNTELDMTGWVLPPIGTSLYPFIGNFKGNGETISNLTTDNKIGEGHIVKKPTLVNASAQDSSGILKVYQKASGSSPATFLSSTVDIVGFFGVLGSYSGMASVPVNYESANSVASVALKNLTISSSSSSTLVGLACGYDNATLSGVAVDGSSIYAKENAGAITNITSNLSDYSLVGYATDAALKKCTVRKDSASLPTLNNPNTELGGQNWGGSIDMLHLYTQLAEIRDASIATSYIPATKPFEYVTSETYVNGVEDPSLRVTSKDHRTVSSSYYRYEGNRFSYDEPDSGNPIYASFSFAREMNSSYSSYEDGEDAEIKYNCLYGAKEFTTSSSGTRFTKTTINETRTPVANRFSISDGINYMVVTKTGNNYSISSATAESSATKCYLNNSSNLLFENGNNTIYLNNNNGSLQASGTASTAWTYDGTNHNLSSTVGNTTYYLFYNNGWALTTNQSETYYTIYDDSKSTYLNYSGTSLSTGTTGSKWNFENDRGFYIISGNNTYYLGYNSGIGLSTSTNANHCYTFRDSNNKTINISSETTTGKLYNMWNGKTPYYLYYRNGSWSESTTQSTGDNFTAKRFQMTGHGIQMTQYYDISDPVSTTSNSSYTTYDTYFPLLMEPNTYKPMDQYIDPADIGGQKKYNTGYVVSGCNDTTSSSYQQVWGDIRVSAYPYNYLSNTSTVYARTRYLNGDESIDSKWVALSSVAQASSYKFKKYTSSHAKLDTLLSESSTSNFIHGLHFMPAQISASRYATIGKAVVLDGKTPQVENENGIMEDRASVYYNYQVPQDSIDFNLKSHGYINFYAGTYFNGNNSFFSLHQVIRNSNNNLSTIKEISKVYCPDYLDSAGNYLLGDSDHPYIYQYSDNTWSSYTKVDGSWSVSFVNSKPADTPLLFDCDWIARPDLTLSSGTYYQKLFYFEIPVNAGEYALGSVSGKTGAYLLYLDIGAGAANYKDVEQNENITVSITNLVFPKGVDFVDLDKTPSGFVALALGGNSSVVVISTSNVGIAASYEYTTSNNNSSVLAISKAGQSPPNMAPSTFKVAYQDEPVTSTYLGSSIEKSITTASYTITLERQIIQSYNPNAGSGTRSFSYSESYTITNGVNGRKIQLPNNGGNNASWEKTSGNGTVTGTGLVTFTGSGTLAVHSSWTESEEIGEASNWNPLSSNNPEGAETSPVVEFHFLDHSDQSATPPNVVVTYEYTGVQDNNGYQTFTYTLTVTNTSGRAVLLVIESIKLSYSTEPDTTYAIQVKYGNTTTSISSPTSISIPTA